MTSWTLVPCLVQLRTEINTLAPARAKGADGSIGDTAHAAGGTSDHLPDEDYAALRAKDADKVDEVHALDITTELNAGDLTLERVVQHILARCRSGAEKRLRYIIFNRRIWQASTGWLQQTYTGTSDPHTGHAHFSASYDSTLEASTAPWLTGLTGDNMIIHYGETSELVGVWQQGLTELGYGKLVGDLDNQYGLKLRRAIAQFRIDCGTKPEEADKYDYPTRWTVIKFLRALARLEAGEPGKAGRDGVLTGELTIVGGQLQVTTAPPSA